LVIYNSQEEDASYEAASDGEAARNTPCSVGDGKQVLV